MNRILLWRGEENQQPYITFHKALPILYRDQKRAYSSWAKQKLLLPGGTLVIFIQIDLVCTAEPPRCLLFSYSLTWSTMVKALLSASSAGQELQNPALSFLPVQLSSSKTSVLPSFPCHRSPGRGALGSFHGLKTVPNHRVRFTMGSPPSSATVSHGARMHF